MPKKIYVRTRIPPPVQRPRQRREAPDTIRSDDKVLVHLESEDPRLLDMEARRLYEILTKSRARVVGPIPVPIKVSHDAQGVDAGARVHRRLMKIVKSTEETILLLEKLEMSHHVSIAFEVEETSL